MELTAEMVKQIIGESEWTQVDLAAKIIKQNVLNENLLFAINQGNYTEFEFLLSEGANPYANQNLGIRQIMISENLDMYRYARDNLFSYLTDSHKEEMVNFILTHSTISGNQEIFTKVVADFGLSQEKKNYYALIGCKNPHLIEMTDYLLANGADYDLVIANANLLCQAQLIHRKELRDLNEKLCNELPRKTTTTRKLKI